MRSIITLILITLTLSACQTDLDARQISQMVTQVISECPDTDFDICQQIPLDADQNNQVGGVEILDGGAQIAKLEWQWEWGEQKREVYQITVSLEDASLQPMQVVLIEKERHSQISEEIQPGQIVQLDTTLPVSVAYVTQFGRVGERLIIKQISGLDPKSQTEKVIQSTIIKEPTDWVIVKGQQTERQVKGNVTRLVRNYFADYQAGNLAGLSELAPDAAKYSYQSEFYLTDFEVRLPEEIKIKDSPERAQIEGSPITEPFTLQANVPVKISGTLFGIEFNEDKTMPLTWSSEEQKWTMPFWGVTRAVALAEGINLNANTITLDGVATTHEATLIALTVTRHLPTTISVEGYQQQDELLLFKLPRAYKWIKQLPKPDQNELMITIESVPAAPKTIKVNLDDQIDNPTPISGVQGRVEWGPTCGNPSTVDPDTCGNIPYQATLTVTEPSGLIVSQTVSDANGLYRIELSPGEYVLIPESNEFMPAGPIPFTVNAGELTYIPVIYPSMIP